MSESLLLASLNSQINLTRRRLEVILEKYSSLEQALQDNFNLLALNKIKWLEKFEPRKLPQIKSDLQSKLDTFGIKILTVLDTDFPVALHKLTDCPGVLYYQGDLKALQNPTITVVGSRKISAYAEKIMRTILVDVVSKQFSLVSGLALGVDSLAHQICLEHDQPTLAVIGSGLNEDVFYPSQNLKLKQKILDQEGLVLSEYEPDFESTIYSFPRRNRLVAALSQVTVVIQASKRSGSLITAGISRDLGQTVCTIPANIFDPDFSGNIELIKQGANVISNADDLLQLFGLSNHQLNISSVTQDSSKTNSKGNLEISLKKLEFMDDFQKRIYEVLDFEPRSVEYLVYSLKLDLSLIQSYLATLEVDGLAFTNGENLWFKV